MKKYLFGYLKGGEQLIKQETARALDQTARIDRNGRYMASGNLKQLPVEKEISAGIER